MAISVGAAERLHVLMLDIKNTMRAFWQSKPTVSAS
jgi:hypothetical protein